jgi:hypothetical protein
VLKLVEGNLVGSLWRWRGGPRGGGTLRESATTGRGQHPIMSGGWAHELTVFLPGVRCAGSSALGRTFFCLPLRKTADGEGGRARGRAISDGLGQCWRLIS